MVVVFALLTFAVSRAVLGQRTSIGQAWAAAKSRVPAMIGLVLLVGVVTLGAFVPTFGAIVLAVTVGDARTGFLAVGLTALASLVLVVWGSIKLLFAPSVLVLEGLGPLKSIKRSWGLTRRRWWRLFGITWLVQLLVGLVAQIIATPIMVIGAVLATATAAWVSIVIMLVGPVAATVITTPYTAAVNTLLYIDARMRSEGLDIQLVKAASEHRQ
jgi:hypothetical protein